PGFYRSACRSQVSAAPGDLLRPALVDQADALRDVVEIGFPRDAFLAEAVEEGGLVLLKPALDVGPMLAVFGHVDPAAGRAGEGEEAVGPCWAGHRREPVIADEEVSCEAVQGGKETGPSIPKNNFKCRRTSLRNRYARDLSSPRLFSLKTICPRIRI